MLSAVLLVAAIVLVSIAGAFFVLFRRIVSPARALSFSQDWLQEFSVAKYKPMARLLTDDDFAFLARQPGYAPHIIRKLRAERRAIFREYLKCLTRDFERLYGAIQLLMLTSSEDQPDLAAALLKHKWVFAKGVLAVHFRLFRYSLGKNPIALKALLSSLDAMHAELQQLASPRAYAMTAV